MAANLAREVEVAKDSAADALAYLGFGGILPVMWQALAGGGWQPPSLTNTAGMHWYVLPAEIRRHGKGGVFVDMYDENNDVTRALCDELERRHGARPFGPLAPAMYDMATLVVGALRHATVHTREGVHGTNRAEGSRLSPVPGYGCRRDPPIHRPPTELRIPPDDVSGLGPVRGASMRLARGPRRVRRRSEVCQGLLAQ